MRPQALAAALLFAAPVSAEAAVRIGPERIVVYDDDAQATITRSPFRIQVEDASGKVVLQQVEPDAGGTLPLPAHSQSLFGTQTDPPPALYSPFTFLVGDHSIRQFMAQQWEGNLVGVDRTGIEYSARDVTAVTKSGAGVRLTVSTTDPSGRNLIVTVRPGHGSTIGVNAVPDPPDGVAAMADSFGAASTEAFHGFGGRHNSLDQRGGEFYNWLQQENLSSGSTTGLTDPSVGDTYMFPNGEHAAYYVQSSFISSNGYGFLLENDELSHWRMAYDQPDTWRVEAAAPKLDYLVFAGGAKRAIRTLTSHTGRQSLPPDWALGSIFDRLVKFPEDPPESHLANVKSDLEELEKNQVPVDAYRIEGWQFLPRDELKQVIAELRSRDIHPMLYFRLFVGEDEIGTDDPAMYREAVDKGYVATRANGEPYTFISNFNANGAQIDFTEIDAIAWWKDRIKDALDLGADGFMQDFGEQVLHDMHFDDGNTGEVMHNRLAGKAHMATRAAVEEYEAAHPERELFFYTRAGHSGRPGAAFSEFANFPGDETTDWTRASGLASLTTDMLNRAVGGAWGFTTDIGGFFDVGPYEPTSQELFTRWAQWAALSPFFRLHGSVGAGTHTPWSYGEKTVWAYNALARLHRRARPLIRSLWKRALKTGIPMTRPMWLAYPDDDEAAKQDQQWMLGSHVLVAPVVEEAAVKRDVYFPRGCWRSPESGQRFRGPKSIVVKAELGDLPYFFECGTHPFRPFLPGAGVIRCGAEKATVRIARRSSRGTPVKVDFYIAGGRRQSLERASLPRRVSVPVSLPNFDAAVVVRTDRGHAARTTKRCR